MTEPRSTETRRKARAGLVCVRVGARTYWVPSDLARRIEKLVARARALAAPDTGGNDGEWACKGGTRLHCHVFCTCDGSKAEDIDPRL